ncbi:type II secretion system minor pseudopilin GspK [Sphingomonas sp. So64.6b]|uniref:type II secretion system minor pseudopilin GspK n=1 Tax=Sphingomonas sp. So64.6b TaxID=2997354 RepID=UPI0016041224|nr:type II secretion system minor pseudopilin GspK [Sphingomonas sp. So64.6b]QNA84108.1 type II secretion system minor pseudopilin GspK [Sphingomonas sp. So64.6b]
MTRPADRHEERGAALLTVLLLVAVIAVLSATALEKLRLATRLSGNAAATEQARAYAYAAETLALTKVSDLLGRDAARVTLVGGWSGKPFPLPVPGGLATARVQDGGNCFNLNGLVVETEPGIYAAYTPARIQFVRLMRLVGVPVQVATPISDAASDWIDSDTNALPAGAEDSTYLGAVTPYRTANTLMADPSELRAVTGVTPEIYTKIRPWLCTLPIAAPSIINVNTLLPEQAPLFAMLLPDTLTVEAARQMLLKRPPQGYESTNAFWQLPALSGITQAPDAVAQTGVTTHWFALDVNVTLGGAELEQQSTIDATRLPARLVSRHWGERS